MKKKLFLLIILIISTGISAQKMENPSVSNNQFIQKSLENGENIQIRCSDLYNNKKLVKITSTSVGSSWNQSFEISSKVRLVDLVSSNKNDLYIAGYKKKNCHEYNITLYQINKDKGMIFSKEYENEGIEIPKKLMKTLDNNLIIGGFSTVNDDSYYAILTNDLHLLKTDLQGVRVWSKTLGLKKIDEELLDMSITSDNEILLVAKRKFFNDKVYITKINKFGNISWQSDFELGHFISSANITLSPDKHEISINTEILDLEYETNDLYNKNVTLVINNDGEELRVKENSIKKLDNQLSNNFVISGNPKQLGIVKTNSLNIRNNPTLASGVVASIHKGDMVEIVDKSKSKVNINNMNDYWYLLKVNDNDTGWAFGHFIDVVK